MSHPAADSQRNIAFQPGEERAKLDQTIRDFRQGKINVIVSTAVLEEGNEKAFKHNLITFGVSCQ